MGREQKNARRNRAKERKKEEAAADQGAAKQASRITFPLRSNVDKKRRKGQAAGGRVSQRPDKPDAQASSSGLDRAGPSDSAPAEAYEDGSLKVKRQGAFGNYGAPSTIMDDEWQTTRKSWAAIAPFFRKWQAKRVWQVRPST